MLLSYAMGWQTGKPAERRRLKAKDKKKILGLLNRGELPVRVVRRLNALLAVDNGITFEQASGRTGLALSRVREVWKRYRESGWRAAGWEKARPGAKRLLSPAQEQKVVALVCTSPPEGHARWSTQLLAEHCIKRGIVESVGKETIRLVLKHHGLKPWREKNVVHSKTR